ncbi:uncharacterized protein LOC141577521 [Camelus bactrianus]|uniref:Uncharacterized protein LOC141577521 n=1 Tax=Camelus bactrianus TaxID=9837 RepID=A0AC58Q8Y7_CAMBA
MARWGPRHRCPPRLAPVGSGFYQHGAWLGTPPCPGCQTLPFWDSPASPQGAPSTTSRPQPRARSPNKDADFQRRLSARSTVGSPGAEATSLEPAGHLGSNRGVPLIGVNSETGQTTTGKWVFISSRPTGLPVIGPGAPPPTPPSSELWTGRLFRCPLDTHTGQAWGHRRREAHQDPHRGHGPRVEVDGCPESWGAQKIRGCRGGPQTQPGVSGVRKREAVKREQGRLGHGSTRLWALRSTSWSRQTGERVSLGRRRHCRSGGRGGGPRDGEGQQAEQLSPDLLAAGAGSSGPETPSHPRLPQWTLGAKQVLSVNILPSFYLFFMFS